jgi:conserved oligomeric Golgi complex subunit 2
VLPCSTCPALVNAHLPSLQLVAVINEDYGEYANLSTRMVNLEGAVVRMQKPLTDLQVHTPLKQWTICGVIVTPQ